MSAAQLGRASTPGPAWERAEDGAIHAYAGHYAACSGYAMTPLPDEARVLFEVIDPDHEPEDHGIEHDQYLGDDDAGEDGIDVPLGPDTCPDCVREITRLHTQAGAA